MQVSSMHSGDATPRTSLANDILRVFTSKLNAKAFLSFSIQVKQYVVLAAQKDVRTRMRYLLSTITRETKTVRNMRVSELHDVYTYTYPSGDSFTYTCDSAYVISVCNRQHKTSYGPSFRWARNLSNEMTLSAMGYYHGDATVGIQFYIKHEFVVSWKAVEVAKFYFTDGNEQSYRNALRRMQWCWNDLLAHDGD